MTNLSSLTWSPPDIPEQGRLDGLIGPGGPFEMSGELVHGGGNRIGFVQRPPNLSTFLDRVVEAHGQRSFTVCGTERLTYDEFATKTKDIAGRLRDGLGVGKGDRVGILGSNSVSSALLHWGVILCGAIAVGLNPWSTPAELGYALEVTDPTIVIGDPRPLKRLQSALTMQRCLKHSELPNSVPRQQRAAIECDEDDPALILFTSGTTGRAKAATISHRNLTHFAMVIGLVRTTNLLAVGIEDLEDPSACLVGGPFHHLSGIAPILVTGPALGSKIVLSRKGRWEPLELTAEERINIWMGVPTQYRYIVDHADFDSHDLRCVLSINSAGAPLPPSLAARLQEKMPWAYMSNTYGMTETTGIGTSLAAPIGEIDSSSVGTPQPTSEVEIRRDDGDIASEAEIGEIFLRSSGVFLGYWNDPDATQRSITRDGWYRTGDFGKIKGGQLYVESRMRDLIIKGGENVYPVEIEHCLIAHPNIIDAAVLGMEDPTMGQVIRAVVVTKESGSTTEGDLRAWVAERVAAFKVPSVFEFRESLPYTETGKVRKHLL